MSFWQSRTRAAREGFGKPVLRKDDARLLVGGGCYSDDVNLPGQAYAYMVRSPHAHARIRGIDVADALAVPGVVPVLTGRGTTAGGPRPDSPRPVPPDPPGGPPRGRDGP